MAEYDRTLGALLLASWLNASLFTVEGLQIYEYFNRFQYDSLFNKVCVLSAMVSDVGGMIAVLSASYLYCVTHFGDAVYAESQPWSMPLYVITSALSGAITQTFLSLRIYRLTGFILYPIFFAIISSGSLAGGLWTAIDVARSQSTSLYSERSKLSTSVILWLSCAAAVDILIACALVWTLIRTETHFSETDSLLRRLMVSAVKTGSVTAGAAIIALVLFSWSPNDNLCVFFSLSLGRLYTISMLSNLNARSSRGRGRPGRPYSSGERIGDRAHTPAGINLHEGATELKGVKVTSDTVTRIDELEEEEEAAYGMRLNDIDGKQDCVERERQREGEPRQSDAGSSTATAHVPYQSPNHRDEWDSERPLEHSQVDLRS